MTYFDIPSIANADLAQQLSHRIAQKTKPLGALGRLEALALQIGLIQQTTAPHLKAPTVLVFAADHGISQAGVSPYPQAVTAQMVHNFLQGGAAINVFAKQHQMRFQVVDSGVNAALPAHPWLIDAKIAMGTANFLNAPAMQAAQCAQALQRGAEVVRAEIALGSNVFVLGEMGIANTSSASLIMHLLTGLPLAACVGRGTGLDDAGLAHKQAVLAQALQYHLARTPQLAQDPLQVLATVGGFEIAMMVGAMLAAAEARCVVLVDGFIATAALLVAHRCQPHVMDYCVFAHCSGEAGHRALLQHLQATPLLDLSLRLGEGTGAVLAYPLLVSAVGFLNHMASFGEAGVSQAQNQSQAQATH